MNREKHIAALEKYRNGILSGGINVSYDDLMVALDTSITALRGPQPDSDTGLVPCGCGEVAERLKLGYQRAVACKNGHVFTGWKDTQKQADDMWNTAMGYNDQ